MHEELTACRTRTPLAVRLLSGPLFLTLLLSVGGPLPLLDATWAADTASAPIVGVSPGEIAERFFPLPDWPGRAGVMDMVLAAVVVATIIVVASRRPRVLRLNWLIVALSFFLSARYMVWRGLYTLNTEDPVSLGASLAVFVAELYGVGGMAFFYLQVINPLQRSTARSDVGARPTVDVFVTICDEPIDILRRTLVACQAMEYPADRKRIFVLDDAGRADVRQLAARLGCVYLSRPTHEHAKAGNLNFALAHSHGALVLIFDTDHVPVRTFLLETVGQFEDLKVAIVQTPHHFYNPDLFQRNFRLQDRLVNEQDLFFQVVQPGRDRHNSVFFCGSGGIFRRAALDEIGGFATASVTEDIHTSVLLHAKGYRSVYVNKRLAAGLAPESYASYLRQRQRWTRGHLQIFLSAHNPLFVRGLTVAQRIDYFASIYYFLLGPARMVFLLAPLVYLLFGKYVVVTDLTSLLTFYVAHYIGGVVASGVLARGFRNPFWGDLYETVMSVPLTSTTVATVLLRRPWPFLVTPKGIRSPDYRFDVWPSVPYLVIVAALLVGIGLGIAEIVETGRFHAAVVISLLWGAYNAVLCATVTLAARERPQRRAAPRLPVNRPCELDVAGTVLSARTFDLSDSGLRLFLNPPRFLPPVVDLRLLADDGEISVLRGRVVRNDRVGDRSSFVGIEFGELTDVQQASVTRQMYSSPSTWEVPAAADTAMGRSLWWLATAVFRSFAKDDLFRRLAPRYPLGIPCELVSQDTVVGGTTEDMSEKGLLIRFPPGTERLGERCLVRLIPGLEVYTVRGRVVWQRSRVGGLYVGIFCEEPVSRFLITWIEFAQRDDGRVQATPTETT